METEASMQTAIHRWYDGTEDDAAWGDADPRELMEVAASMQKPAS
jgi:hypothetical protein